MRIINGFSRRWFSISVFCELLCKNYIKFNIYYIKDDDFLINLSMENIDNKLSGYLRIRSKNKVK